MSFAMRLLFCILIALWSLAARAQDLAPMLDGLTDADPRPAIEALVAESDPRARKVLEALAAGNLFRRLSDNVVVIGEKDGENYVITNPVSGEIEAMAAADEVEAIALPEEAKAALTAAGIGADTAEAQPLDYAGAVQALNGESFDDKRAAIARLAELGDARAIPVLQALSEGRLFARKSDGTVVIGQRAGNAQQITDAVTGADRGVVAAGELDAIFINNALRNTVRDEVGRMGLLAPIPDTRRAAADALFGANAGESLTLLREALGKETNSAAKEAMTRAIASAEVADADPAKRIAAAAVLGGATDLRTQSLLQGRLGQETDAAVQKALSEALSSVQGRLSMIAWLANLFQGISLGSVLLLAAIGLAITFGVMGVINMAHGEMIMLGAYAAYVVQEVFRAFLPPAWFDFYLVAAVPVGFLVGALAGIAIERSVIRWLYGRALETMLATWGVSLILQQLVRTIFGAPNKEVANPTWMSGGFELLGGFTVTWNRLLIIIFCFAVLGIIALVLQRTAFGLHMRAVTQNRRMAATMGIPTARVDALTFGLGSGVAGMAGVALSQIGNVSPNLGTIYIVDSFLVVVFGGVGNLLGTLVGAMSLGIANKFLEPVAGAVLAKVAILVLIILFIQKRPRGLFALKGRSVEN